MPFGFTEWEERFRSLERRADGLDRYYRGVGLLSDLEGWVSEREYPPDGFPYREELFSVNRESSRLRRVESYASELSRRAAALKGRLGTLGRLEELYDKREEAAREVFRGWPGFEMPDWRTIFSFRYGGARDRARQGFIKARLLEDYHREAARDLDRLRWRYVSLRFPPPRG